MKLSLKPTALRHLFCLLSQLLLCFIITLPAFATDATNAATKEKSKNHAIEKQYEIGIFPHLSKNHLERTYRSIINNLSKGIGHTINFDANESISHFYSHLKKEYYDIVLIQPFEYIAMNKEFGYIPLGTQEHPLKALIVTKKNGPIQNIQNLLGRKLSLPPRSTAISYLTKKHLHDFGFNLDKDISFHYESTHVACLQKLLLGFTDACATLRAALNFFERKMEVKFQVISETDAIPHILFAAHPRVNAADRAKLVEVLLNWGQSPEGKKMLKNKWLMPFRRIADEDFDVVRRIKKEVDGY